jgi:hypothetical protein
MAHPLPLASLRCSCETIFSFLIAYVNGLKASNRKSVDQGNDHTREGSPAWMSSHQLAKEALQLAASAASEAAGGNFVPAGKMTELAAAEIEER